MFTPPFCLLSYVEQFDTLVGELTVSEMLYYTSELLLPSSTGRSARRSRVEQVVADLRLEVVQGCAFVCTAGGTTRRAFFAGCAAVYGLKGM